MSDVWFGSLYSYDQTIFYINIACILFHIIRLNDCRGYCDEESLFTWALARLGTVTPAVSFLQAADQTNRKRDVKGFILNAT